ncbi:hypothetical protein H4582DRAFT_2024019 [Lactarius indigo]|nr:hypothetical protein H4582DRAFT_2024019 [Lactarius indigo]
MMIRERDALRAVYALFAYFARSTAVLQPDRMYGGSSKHVTPHPDTRVSSRAYIWDRRWTGRRNVARISKNTKVHVKPTTPRKTRHGRRCVHITGRIAQFQFASS